MTLIYMEPKSVKEAVEMLTDYPGSKVLAGGTDLIPALNKGKLDPKVKGFITLKHLQALRFIKEKEDGTVIIGAMTTLDSIGKSRIINQRAISLAEACGVVGSKQVRNIATVVGNICNGSPSADTAPALLALDVILVVEGPQGERELPIKDFFIGPFKNSLQPGELVTSMVIPPQPVLTSSAYLKHSPRKNMDIAWAGAAVTLTVDGNFNLCEGVRVGLGAVAEMPIRAIEAETFLQDKPLDEDTLNKFAQIASEECRPNPKSRRVAPEYRREMVKVLVKRAVDLSLERIRNRV